CFALLDWCCDLLFSPTLPMGVFPTCTQLIASSMIPVFLVSHAGGTSAGRSSGIISLYCSKTSFTAAGSSELGFSSSSAAMTSAR
ncbi:unnamed protein product, partial [Closterium sp. NIES-53]